MSYRSSPKEGSLSSTSRKRSTKTTRPIPVLSESRIVTNIIKLLEHCTGVGLRPDDVFSDWLALINALLEMEPKHAQALAETGQFAPDTHETTELLARLRRTYPHRAGAKIQYLEYFVQAFAELRSSTLLGYEDIIGCIYMQWGWPNDRLGQYFTPMAVAKMMATITIGDGRAEVHRRLEAAIAESPAAQAALLAGTMLESEVAHAWLVARVIPYAIAHYKPLTIADCCCGSGVMVLAAAENFDPWMNQLGLVQYYGQDVDDTCVLMARINVQLYGLNGHARWQVMRHAEAVLRHSGMREHDVQPDEVVPVQHVIPFPDRTGETQEAA
jgi:hypothetical protein